MFSKGILHRVVKSRDCVVELTSMGRDTSNRIVVKASSTPRQIRKAYKAYESCCNDYHQSYERILAEPEVRTSDLMFLGLLCYRLSHRGLATVSNVTTLLPNPELQIQMGYGILNPQFPFQTLCCG